MTAGRRGRTHDAEGAREAILNAAEEVFAEHGFDGARSAVIAAVAGYNSSLIFQYFGDKLGLYTAVLMRADKEMAELQTDLLAPLLEDEMITSDARKFKKLLAKATGLLFDYLIEHTNFTRMLSWEMAEGWQTYVKIFSRFQMEDIDQFQRVLSKAKSVGLLRSTVSPLIQLSMTLQICQSYLAYLPLYQLLQTDENLSSPEALARGREYIIDFVVAGLMVDPEDKTT